jgi:hypothetical protein
MKLRTADLETGHLCKLAAARSACRLADGSLAVLVRWPGDYPPDIGQNVRRAQRGRARVLIDGKGRTVPAGSVVEVWDDVDQP